MRGVGRRAVAAIYAHLFSCASWPSTTNMSAASPKPTKDALELNRLAGGLTTASGLYFVCLARIPYSFTYTEDPLASEPITTLCVASVTTWMFSLYTSSRLRSWWRQDLNDARERSQKEAEATGATTPDAPMVDVDRSERTIVVRKVWPSCLWTELIFEWLSATCECTPGATGCNPYSFCCCLFIGSSFAIVCRF